MGLEGSIIKLATKCPKCGAEELGAKYYTNEDGSIKQTLYCSKCGCKVEFNGKNRYQAKKGALELWKEYKEKPVVVEVKKSVEKKVVKEKTDKPEKTFNKFNFNNKKNTEITDKAHAVFTKDKNDLIKQLKTLIVNFEKNNPSEMCPCTLTDLMKLYGFSDDEISSYLEHPKSRKKFLKKPAEILDYINRGETVYTRDKEGTVYKYTPVKKLTESQETLDMFEAIGLTRYCYVLNK